MSECIVELVETPQKQCANGFDKSEIILELYHTKSWYLFIFIILNVYIMYIEFN